MESSPSLPKPSHRHETIEDVARRYEEAIGRRAPATPEPYIELALAYFLGTEGSNIARHRPSPDFLDRAWRRVMEVLDEAAKRFGSHTEVMFWRLYLPWIRLGGTPIDETCRALASRGDSLLPYLHLFMVEPTDENRGKALLLYRTAHGRRLPTQRYIRGALEGLFGDRPTSARRPHK